MADANERSMAIEAEYKQRLQERLAQVDAEKAVSLGELERFLNERQETVLTKAKQDIDLIQSSANDQKIAVFKEAQARANQQMDQITEQVAELVAEDAQHRLQSKTQTVCVYYLLIAYLLIVFLLFRLLRRSLLLKEKIIWHQLMLMQWVQPM